MKRRHFLAGTAALAAPRLATAAGRALRFIPYVDLAILDPMINTATQTRTHGYAVFDTLYGMDSQYRPRPQMLEGDLAEDDGRVWTLTLRPGLRFHDGEPVLARDVVASVRRWAARDEFGETLMEATDSLEALDDRRLRFRMKHRFSLLPDALGKLAPTMPAIMPARLAATDPTKPVAEIIGSGPYRFVAGERVPGARNVYEAFAGYVPRDEPADLTAGGKRAWVQRVEWLTMPDAATAAAAIQSGEADWWEGLTPDLAPLLRRARDVRVEILDRTGVMPILRFNCLQKPFDNAAIRRAVLSVIEQRAFVSAYASDPTVWNVPVGIFPPGLPMANEAGLAGRFGTPDLAAARQAVLAAGYAGERVVVMNPTDHPVNTVMAQVTADLFSKIGLKVDLVSMDAGTMFQRRTNRADVDHGGWSCFPSMINAMDSSDPAVSFLTRGNGAKAWYGWPTSPEVERLREAWLAAPDLAERQRLCRDLQSQIFTDAPYAPLGQIFQPNAIRQSVTGILPGFPKFWNVKLG